MISYRQTDATHASVDARVRSKRTEGFNISGEQTALIEQDHERAGRVEHDQVDPRAGVSVMAVCSVGARIASGLDQRC
jgi:hypothetical protein